MHELHIAFIPKKHSPITTINHIIDQLAIDFQREGLKSFKVSVGTFTTDEHTDILIHQEREVENEDGKESDVQASKVEP